MIQAKKHFLFAPDFEDIENEDIFKYPLFESTRKIRADSVSTVLL